MKNIYTPIKTIVNKVIDETPNIKTFVLIPEETIKFKPGQFIQLCIPTFGEAPFTPSSSPSVQDKIELTIMKVGRLTEKIHALKPFDVVGIRGPYGNPYPVETFYEKEVLLVGGGVGFAPLRSLLLFLLEQQEKFKRIIVCYGAKTPTDILYKEMWRDWRKNIKVEIYRSVDKADTSWRETEGVVTTLLDKFKIDVNNSVAIVCGPPIMMKFTTFKLLDMGHKPENIYLSMERNMSCGVGKCGHCCIGPYFVCKDGPVFSYAKIKDEPEIWA